MIIPRLFLSAAFLSSKQVSTLWDTFRTHTDTFIHILQCTETQSYSCIESLPSSAPVKRRQVRPQEFLRKAVTIPLRRLMTKGLETTLLLYSRRPSLTLLGCTPFLPQHVTIIAWRNPSLPSQNYCLLYPSSIAGETQQSWRTCTTSSNTKHPTPSSLLCCQPITVPTSMACAPPTPPPKTCSPLSVLVFTTSTTTPSQTDLREVVRRF